MATSHVSSPASARRRARSLPGGANRPLEHPTERACTHGHTCSERPASPETHVVPRGHDDRRLNRPGGHADRFCRGRHDIRGHRHGRVRPVAPRRRQGRIAGRHVRLRHHDTGRWPLGEPGRSDLQLPALRSGQGTTPQFWDNYVEELVTAGVDFVAVDTRGYIPGSAVPNQGGDSRALAGLVDPINRGGYADRLKIAAFDDIPASLTHKKNQFKHHAGGYSSIFDRGDTNGSGEGGYQYPWKYGLRSYFQTVPDNLLYKVSGQPVVCFWSDNAYAFTNQGNGN
ncbi:DUF5010 domain-containing protein [Streptomyces sp. NPDC086777]|uniref:DUF5010 domain-containing protein n=1 Tax=Streptomyces sp. NPDC086777 TaxID=3154866 RepID=UPI00344B7AEF